jgi:hypothetical protein
LFEKGKLTGEVAAAVLGGGLGGAGGRDESNCGFAKAVLLKESLRSKSLPRSCRTSGMGWLCGCAKRLAMLVLARRACVTTGISFSMSSSASRTGVVPNLRLKGKVAEVFVGELARK